MNFLEIYFHALLLIMAIMTLLWITSIFMKNVSIVDQFWGLGFVITNLFYFFNTEGTNIRKLLIIVLVTTWGLRLTLHIAFRNFGKGEDFRYQQFREHYGPKNYWWISFFQTFLLQGVLMWLISAPLLGAQFYAERPFPGVFDIIGFIFWCLGIVFESVGDFQLSSFRKDLSKKGKLLDTGLWKYTRHPNYFGDASVWWGYGFISLAAGSYIPVLGSLLMIYMIVKVSGVALLEKSLIQNKPGYAEYARRTSAFIPWFPKK
jgi:steroid 5-alpha reductase family enzyme